MRSLREALKYTGERSDDGLWLVKPMFAESPEADTALHAGYTFQSVFNLEWAAPEVHLDYGEPTYFLDVFALGLTFGFTLIGQHLFGITKSEQIDQIKNCQKMTPKAEQLLLRVGKEALDLVKSMLVSLASQRPRAKQILKHRYFQIQTKESGLYRIQSF